MAVIRRFLIASSLTRLIRKERGSERVMEGHFPPQGERQSHVRIEKGQAYLVLTSLEGEVSATEDWTDVPRSHAEALLDVCPGTVVFERSRVPLRDREAVIDRFMTPTALDVVSVDFATKAEADAFLPPIWFGTEVTGDDSYTGRAIAIAGRPRAPEVPLSNSALETVLDLLESRPEEGQHGQHGHYESAPERQVEPNVFDRLRRLAAVRPASPFTAAPTPAAPAPVEPEPEQAAEQPQSPAEGVARLRTRRPVLPIASSKTEDGDERLAGVIQGLSEALSQTSAEKDGRFGS
jgi:CYTH domain-containing protein